ncbi:trypsin-like peptidase domain-containing protein [Bacteroidia bacterium]|nr:trypsin-like peptidase domain-containing protein [Bacteroidia bacterium]MDB9882737.1 trypsin-like peptidase domain-containing protein [Bacteroidia bacterium]MDC1395799.1 trypsin-like peptidase domain-containing protein [Bacteroidia bacterium]
MKKRHIIILASICLMASFIGAFAYKTFFSESERFVVIESKDNTPYRNISHQDMANLETGFITSSEKSTPSVVFIKTESQYQPQSFWRFDFDPFGRIGKVASTGSGVIVSQDGYIVTNQHVIKNADKIEVVLNSKKTFAATLIGSDPSSDLALLKIIEDNLTPIQFTNSDQVKIGQWVLAVGNPFNLTSTVTAGIVSAKGRNINIVNNQFPIESFIQTDAAINPGNSGGALVDLNGNLVGVNTAIASKTGSYVGYGFAIPSNIVAKTIEDLKNYGEVQRGFLGVDVTDIDGEIIEKMGANNGVMVSRVTGTNEAASSKLEAGDVITKVDGTVIDSKSSFDERIAYLRPGDIAKLEVFRDNKRFDINISLVNKEGTTELIKKESKYSEVLGGEFELISKLERDTYKIPSGIKVSNITNGKLRKMNLSEGFIFVKVNNQTFDDVDDLIYMLENHKGQIRIEGIKNGVSQYLSYSFY